MLRVIILYTSVLLRVLVGKGYGVRASEYGLAPPTVQVRNIRTGNILFHNPIFCLHRRYKNDAAMATYAIICTKVDPVELYFVTGVNGSMNT